MGEGHNSIRIGKDEMDSVFRDVLIRHGMDSERSAECAGIFTINSLEGIYSHGINRFPRFVKYIDAGYVRVNAVPSLIHASGNIEQWEGNLGAGPLNALFATERAMKLASGTGIGLVALANTNHWMRGGYYGWHAARKGFAFIGWANTCVNMPAWGGKDPRLGNNPFVIAVPYNPEAVVLDFAMTQYSYGKMEAYHRNGEKLPYPGGFNRNGELTDDPGEILDAMRPLPAGYWKGAGLSVLLDILAAILSGGLATHQIGDCEREIRISQVFIAVDLTRLHNFSYIRQTLDNIINDLKKSETSDGESDIRYPGENIVRTRTENSLRGIPVSKDLWEAVLAL